MDLFVDERASSLRLLKVLFKNIILIAVFSIVGLAVGIGVTFFIPKKYHSFAIIFPPNSNLGLDVLEDPRFGNNMDADQLMQLLDSKQIKDTIVQLYNLEEYYDIDKSEKSWQQQLDKKYFKDINFSKTRYYSIVVTANMRDPELSANIVNSIVEMVDYFRAKIMRQNQLAVFEYAKEQYIKQQMVVDSLKKLIYTKKQTSNPENILYNHLLENAKSDFLSPTRFVDSEEMENLIQTYSFELIALNDLKGDYHKALRLIQKPFSKVFVLNKGVPNYKKTSPSFVLNGLAGLSSSFIFIIIFVIVRDKWSTVIKMLKEQA
jgi:capsular polysaccharide biosynthesis protein